MILDLGRGLNKENNESDLRQVPVRREVLISVRYHRGVAVHMLQDRLAHDDQLLDGARQVIVLVILGEELLEDDNGGVSVGSKDGGGA